MLSGAGVWHRSEKMSSYGVEEEASMADSQGRGWWEGSGSYRQSRRRFAARLTDHAAASGDERPVEARGT